MEPRLLTKKEAAEYCRVSISTFENWVREGLLPPSIPGTHRWDIKAIDLSLDRQSGIEPKSKPSAIEEWKAGRHARAS